MAVGCRSMFCLLHLISPTFLISLLSTNMSGLQCLASENIWFDKPLYDEAEKCFYEGANGPPSQVGQAGTQTWTHGCKTQEEEQSCFVFSSVDLVWCLSTWSFLRLIRFSDKPISKFSSRLLLPSFEVPLLSCQTPPPLMPPCQSLACKATVTSSPALCSCVHESEAARFRSGTSYREGSGGLAAASAPLTVKGSGEFPNEPWKQSLKGLIGQNTEAICLHLPLVVSRRGCMFPVCVALLLPNNTSKKWNMFLHKQRPG